MDIITRMKVVDRNGGDWEFTQIEHFLNMEASFAMSAAINNRIGNHCLYCAADNAELNIKQTIKDAVRDYLMSIDPSEYNPVFESFFTDEERNLLSQSLRGVA